MSRVLLLPYHGIGHLNPFFGLADILKNNGHEVQFAAAEFFRNHAIRSGFNYVPLRSVPFGSGFEKWFNEMEKKSNLYWAELKDRFTDRLYRLRERELLSVLNTFKPEVILLDSTLATDFIVLYPYMKAHGIRAAIVYAMLPTAIVPGRPPVNSTVMPGDAEGYKKAVQRVRWNKRISSWKKKVKFFGMDDGYLIRRRLKKNKIPGSFISPHLSLLNITLERITEFIVIPEEFDFPQVDSNSLRYYTGFRQQSVNTHHNQDEYHQRKYEVFRLKEERRRPLVYCSFGTVESRNVTIIDRFIKKLITVARDENYLLIISLGGIDLDPKIVATGSHNIHIFRSVSQTEVLSKADLFISHGGMSSIRESIEAEVPLLMYPVHTDYDPMGNAARVMYHGLGLLGNIRADGKEELLQHMKELLRNSKYREKIRAFKRVNARYLPRIFIKVFDGLPPL